MVSNKYVPRILFPLHYFQWSDLLSLSAVISSMLHSSFSLTACFVNLFFSSFSSLYAQARLSALMTYATVNSQKISSNFLLSYYSPSIFLTHFPIIFFVPIPLTFFLLKEEIWAGIHFLFTPTLVFLNTYFQDLSSIPALYLDLNIHFNFVMIHQSR